VGVCRKKEKIYRGDKGREGLNVEHGVTTYLNLVGNGGIDARGLGLSQDKAWRVLEKGSKKNETQFASGVGGTPSRKAAPTKGPLRELKTHKSNEKAQGSALEERRDSNQGEGIVRTPLTMQQGWRLEGGTD